MKNDVVKHMTVINTYANAQGKPSTNPTVQCLRCDETFRGGTTKIWGHFAHALSCGVFFCDKVPEVTKKYFEDVEKE